MIAGGRTNIVTEHTGIVDGHTSSRVLAPPGGKTSMAGIFGGADYGAPAPVRKAAPAAPAAPFVPAAVAPAQVHGARTNIVTEHTGIVDGHTSSRVLAPPGGKTSMAGIFGGSEYGAPAPKSAAKPAAAPAPVAAAAPVVHGGYKRVVTEHTGIVDGHTSSRVLAPPGGKTSMAGIFGGYEAPAPVAPRAAPAPVAAAPSGVAGGRVAQRTEYTGISEHSSTRVHAPPGGNTSMAGIFGGSDLASASATDRIEAMKARRMNTAAPMAQSTEARSNVVFG